jgi:hypothetical protein
VYLLVLLAALGLYDGATLSGWQPQGEARWAIEDNHITARGAGDGFLLTEGSYTDFRLHVEFWVDATTNSGVFIRCRDRQRIHPDTCLELNIWDEHPRQEARTGSIVFRAMPPLARVETVGRWNTMDVLAEGPRIEVRVNGQLTAQLDDADPAGGFIALQHWETGTVKFRRLTLDVLED